MRYGIYCLECNAVVGEKFGRGEASRGDRLDVCQTCVQHGGLARGPGVPLPAAPPVVGIWPWRLLARRGGG
jgi:hypothetical protein